MTHVVTSPHHETLKSGRMVYPGQEVSDKEAAKNPHLVERGALTAGASAPEAQAAPPTSTSTGSSAGDTGTTPEEKKSTPSRSRRSKAPAADAVPTKEEQK